jgi:hypothetical protein
MPTFEQVAHYLPGVGPLTDEVIDRLLATAFKDVELTSVIQDVPTLADAMAAAGFMPGTDRPTARQRGAIAAELLRQCEAQKIVFTPPTTTTQSETSGVVRFMEDLPQNLDYRELIDRVMEAVLRGEAADEKYVAELRKKRYTTHFVRNLATNLLDPEASKALIAQVGTNRPPRVWNGITTETIDSVLARKIYSDPFTGEGIYDATNMWLELTEDERAAIIYLREIEKVQLDPVNTHTQLKAKPRSQWWNTKLAAWHSLKNKTDQQSIMTVARVQARLYLQEGGQPGSGIVPFL